MREQFDRPSTLRLPQGPWQTVLACLIAHFSSIEPQVWHDRVKRGRVQLAEGRAITADTPYQAGLLVRYFREVPNESPIPFELDVLYQDEHLLVVDKPHFLPVMPSGEFVRETAQYRLAKLLNNPDISPLHRIDRLTAGVVLFSVDKRNRNAYQALFREQRIDKHYEALAPALPELDFPRTHRVRMVAGEPFFRMAVGEGESNSETELCVLEKRGAWWRYGLSPVSGKKHQLRVHMSDLGAGIAHDPYYPNLLPREQREADDYQRPLQLLARSISFIDPISGELRSFSSRRTLDWQSLGDSEQ